MNGPAAAGALLLAALRSVPRPYRLPPLPLEAEAARAAGPEAALAWAIEAARRARERHAAPPPAAGDLFTGALAALIAAALRPDAEPAFQALLLRDRSPEVAEHLRLATGAAADRRTVRAATDAIAHPGKLRRRAPGPLREGLLQLHGLAAADAWDALVVAAGQLGQGATLENDASLAAALAQLATHPALQRLRRGAALMQVNAVQRYRVLLARAGPVAGSAAAADRGRASARAGARAEAQAVKALRALAAVLDRHAPGHTVVRGLRVPAGFPGAQAGAKDEWDAAIVRQHGSGAAAELVLLAEVKAAPAAAVPDLPRLLRGLQRLAAVAPGSDWAFPAADAEVRLSGSSMRGLRPRGRKPPARVVYCCTAPPEAQPAWLGPAARAVLLAEPASLAFAHRLAAGEAPPPADLLPAWQALATAPRLRAVLHQWPDARAAREAIVHPAQLAASAARLGGTAAQP